MGFELLDFPIELSFPSIVDGDVSGAVFPIEVSFPSTVDDDFSGVLTFVDATADLDWGFGLSIDGT